jgi:hypothetical protein
MELVRSSISIVGGLPRETVRSAPAITFSGPAQRSLTLWPVRSRSRLATLYTESSDSFVASAAASIATGWSEPVPGRELHPLKSSAFHGALFRQVSNRFRGPQVVGLSRAEDSAVNWLASDSSDRSSVRAGWSRAKSHSKHWWCSEDNRFHRTVGLLVLALYVLDSIFG